MERGKHKSRRCRRGASFIEMTASAAVVAAITVPALGVISAVQEEQKRAQIISGMQGDLEHVLRRSVGTIRAAVKVTSLTDSSIQFNDPDNVPHQIFLRDGTLFEQGGSSDPLPLATHVSSFQFVPSRTISGLRSSTTDPARVTDLEIRMTLANNGLIRSGNTFVYLRNIPR